MSPETKRQMPDVQENPTTTPAPSVTDAPETNALQAAAQTVQDSLKAQRDALEKEIEANEQAHKDLIAQKRKIDQQIRDKDLNAATAAVNAAVNAAADAALGPIPDLKPIQDIKTPEETCSKVTIFGRELPSKTAVYGFFCLAVGLMMFPLFGVTVYNTLVGVSKGAFDNSQMMATIIFFVLYCSIQLLLGAGFILLALRMLSNDKKNRLRLCNGLILLMVALFICHLTVFGVGNILFVYVLFMALLVLIHGYFDPEIALERYNEITDDKTLKQMLKKDDVERYTIPGKRSGKGYITLDFFNLFWIFTICSFLGLIIETIWHMTVVDPGVYQDRAGMLWGPLSPIYGFGGSLMTIFLNRLHDKPIWVTFIVSAIVGGAFEYFTSWYLQYAFGITAWDYSGTFLNIDGRTNFMFMCMWGVLGCVWVRLLLPVMLYFMKKIPWRWKYTLTAIFATFVIFDGIMTTVTLDCWYLREDGVPVQGVVETFCANHFDNQFMEDRFQSMSMNVDSSARSDAKVEKSPIIQQKT